MSYAYLFKYIIIGDTGKSLVKFKEKLCVVGYEKIDIFSIILFF